LAVGPYRGAVDIAFNFPDAALYLLEPFAFVLDGDPELSGYLLGVRGKHAPRFEPIGFCSGFHFLFEFLSLEID